jgi:hypothetical protein
VANLAAPLKQLAEVGASMQEGASQIPPGPEQPASGPAISSNEVETELARILTSPLFRKSPRHSRFLTFVVRQTLQGSAQRIKEYSIGLDVFGLGTDKYDPGVDPRVRVEAGRLRSRLAEYYKDSGRHDPIQIRLPKGTYAPVFHRNGVEPALVEGAPDSDCFNNVAHSSVPATYGVKENGPTPSEPRDGSGNSRAVAWPASRLLVLKIVAAIAAIGIAAFILIRVLEMDRQPQAGRLEGSTFVVSNAEGRELWHKSFPDGFSREYYLKAPDSLGRGYDQPTPPRMWFGDLEGIGHSDVLLLYHPAASPTTHSTTLICYSDRGKEQWRWTPGRELPELKGEPTIYRIEGFGVLKGAHGGPSRIVVSSSHALWYPQQIAIVNSNGNTVSEYWHSGHLYNLTLADLDGDGREEIIATGISNGYRQGTLIVLDPDRVFGASTEAARPDLQIHGMGVAKERLRLLFPRSDLNKATLIYNQAEEATILQDRIRVSVLECQQAPRCVVLYDFDRSFQLLSVAVDDQFRGPHEEYFRTHQPVHHLNAEEESAFQKVRCLDGCKTEFVLSQNR